MSRKEHDELKIQLYNIVQKINNQEETLLRVERSKKDLKVYYVWGPPNSGKSELIYSLFEGTNKFYNEVYYRNGFWFGVSNKTNIAIYEGFIDILIPLEEFLIFIFIRIKYLPIKGGQIQNKYNRIFIISEFDPEKIYPKDNSKRWLTRIIIFHINELKENESFKSLFDFLFPKLINKIYFYFLL